MEHMFSSKGKQLLVINNYKFCFHNKLCKNVERWCCANSDQMLNPKTSEIRMT